MRKRERAAALSAVGLMFIAGCSGGGRSVGTSTPALPGGGQQGGAATTTRGNATLQIMVPVAQQGAQPSASRRTTGIRYATNALRHPTWVSPYSAYVGLQVVPTNGGPTYSTSFALSTCTSGYTAGSEPYFNCSVSVPYGSNTFYVSMYDTYNNLLSTNLFAKPAPQTVNPNGSGTANTISIYEQGVVGNVSFTSPVSCFSAGYQQAISLLFQDADGAPIFGPLANPISPNFTAYNGAGFGAIGLYAVYLGGTYPDYAINNGFTLSDTSMYSPYLWVSGQEGAIQIAATISNLPVYSNNAYTYTPYQTGYLATGTYIAWGLGAGNNYGIYNFAIQTSTHQAVPCQQVNGSFQTWTYIGSFIDPSTHAPYLAVSDNANTIHIFDAYVTAEAAGHSYEFFQGPNPYGNAGLQFELAQSSPIVTSGAFINFFTSVDVTGRVNILSNSPSPGSIDLLNTANGIPSGGPGPYTTQIALSGSTRLAGSPGAYVVYYDEPGTPFLYGFYTGGGNSGNTATIDFSSFGPYVASIYDISPSGGALTYEFVRGATSTNVVYLCEFDAANASSFYCNGIGGYDTNPSGMAYDPGSGYLMVAGATANGTSVYAFNAHQSPSSLIGAVLTTPSVYTLAHTATRITPGLAAVPGITGFYGGPQTSGPCTGTGQVTWLQYNGSGAWTYLASTCWPNHFITLTYP